MSITISIRKESAGRKIFLAANGLFMAMTVLIIAIPLAKVFIDSFDERASETVFRLVPEVFTLDAYKVIITRRALYQPFLISLLTTTVGTAMSLMITSFFAYALAQRDLPGRRIFLGMAMITMVFRAGMIPLFLVVKNLGLMNSLWAVILPRLVDAYYLLLLRSFFSTIPTSIMDASRIDGCSNTGTFFRIVLPLSKPGLAAIGLFYLVFYWNQFFEYILYIQTKPALHNFQVFLRSLVIETETQGFEGFSFATQSLKNAAVVASIIPVLIVYPFVQKYFVKGINLGAVKG
ncbi:MAG: carbohydrate ABC transporter permease [Spirochaetaceae bacterium]|nr:carbohydrate ABC transporter permease [Spirochaetaceae bacterium]MDT8297989.1 carbohydrate ABC transporter permease [Spirochaetaceae bacterium]